MTHYAFTEEQEEFLESAAPARPSLWRYECERALVHARKNNELSVSREAIQNMRWYFKRGLINLPPERNLDQYCTAVHSAGKSTSAQTSFATVSRRGKDGEVLIDHLRFIGSDARAWLLVAYRNAEEIIRHADELLKLCDDLLDPHFEFVLDPPEPTSDPREAAITPVLDHFSNMTERKILGVFQMGCGKLVMNESTWWAVGCILEAIRIGLGLRVAIVRNIEIELSDGQRSSWGKRGDNGKWRNFMNEHRSSASSKDFALFTLYEATATKVESELKLLTGLSSHED